MCVCVCVCVYVCVFIKPILYIHVAFVVIRDIIISYTLQRHYNKLVNRYIIPYVDDMCGCYICDLIKGSVRVI